MSNRPALDEIEITSEMEKAGAEVMWAALAWISHSFRRSWLSAML
jgi:hypothetical protein